MMERLTVNYVTRPNSNVGGYQAKAFGHRLTVVNQGIHEWDMPEFAAKAFLDKFNINPKCLMTTPARNVFMVEITT